MIIVPEIETVVILVPRTGSGSLWRAVRAKYPLAMMVYRHMEADGVPYGYDRWRKVGVVREPVARLWSLYSYQRERLAPVSGFRDEGEEDRLWLERNRASVERPFEEWMLNNDHLFSSPYRRARTGFLPGYATHHPIPENRKSQVHYLRPDLGTQVYRYEDQLPDLFWALGVEPDRDVNRTAGTAPPSLTEAGCRHIDRYFAWDLAASKAATPQPKPCFGRRQAPPAWTPVHDALNGPYGRAL